MQQHQSIIEVRDDIMEYKFIYLYKTKPFLTDIYKNLFIELKF